MTALGKLAEVPVEKVAGISGKRADSLRAAGIVTVADLLHHIPRRYIDRSRIEPISLVPIGEEVTVLGKVLSINTRFPRRNLSMTTAQVSDGTGAITVVWFNQKFRQTRHPPGTELALSGKVERFKGRPQMNNPDAEILSDEETGIHTGRVVPIHPAVGEMTPGWFRRAIANALKRSFPMPDPVPVEVIAKAGLMDREQAFGAVHFPETPDVAVTARRRLAFDELFRLELALAMAKRRQEETAPGVSHQMGGVLVDRFMAGLPYRLTGAQTRVIEAIGEDLAKSHPMHRLLQGEVGSGKTVVAMITLLAGIQGGWQGAVMAPTEVLATQHYLGLTSLLDQAGMAPAGGGSRMGMGSLFIEEGPRVAVALVTSSQASTNLDPAASRSDIVDWIAGGDIQLVVGTHALIQTGVEFHRLGVAVVDEQHRFGALQRQDLRDKGGEVQPDLLIMTATPIPRTLAMTVYGDLDVSTIDELPPGRTPIETRHLSRGRESEAWDLLRSEVGRGRQGYVVCPLVEDSEKMELASATAEHERLSKILTGLRVGLLHGQLPPREKGAVMESFRRGEIDVLVATTVIEVGVDVPNATVMVIEDADRFGLSQLHQLRGRIGRGIHPGTCLLIADPATDDAGVRMEAMVDTTDGFRLAEIDLELRGEGTAFAARQSGRGDLRVAGILRDRDLLEEAREEAFALVEADPDLSGHPELRDEVRLLLGEAVEWLFVS